MTGNPDISVLMGSPSLLALMAVAFIVEIALFAWALLDWAKRPAERMRGNRIVWLLVIALLNMIGPIVYMTVARLPEEVADLADAQADAERAAHAVDVLYGDDRIEPR